MNRTSRFISLSGLSGVSTGVIALAGVILAYYVVFNDQQYLVYEQVQISNKSFLNLLFIASGTLILSILNAIYFTRIKTKKLNLKSWDTQSKRLLWNLFIPLGTGGLLCLMLLFKGFIGFLAPLSLLFYGLALVNGSKYTFPEIRTLGLIHILLGLLAFQFIDLGLYFWAFGFGFIQIIYGLMIQRKY